MIKEFPGADVRIHNSKDARKTLVIDLYNSDLTVDEVIEWVSDKNVQRDVFGFGQRHIDIRTEIEGENVLVALESENT